MTYNPKGSFAGTLQDPNSYSHSIAAVGGYWDASFELSANMELIDEWLDTGIGRHIEVYNDAQILMWEGFVNQVSASVGGFTVSRGPFMDVVNRCSVVYSPMELTATSSSGGSREITTSLDNAASAAKYGVVEQVFSAGTVTATEALAIQGLILEELSEPETTKELSTSGSSPPSVKVECLGYVHWMKYVYNQIAISGGWDISEKIADILNADPNGLFSSTNAEIEANALQVPMWEDQDREAFSLIKTLVGQGDVANKRYTFGVYGGRKAVYEKVVEELSYQQLLSDPSQHILTISGEVVSPWNVMPARWLIFPDFLSGRVPPSTLFRRDPRIMFIESVKFQAPNTLTLSGSRVNRLDQKLAQLELGGMG